MDTIDLFKTIRDKFDIIGFYLPITRELLWKSLNHAREYTNITD